MPESRPPWCGHCDRRTRLIIVRPNPAVPGDDVAVRCQECHPFADTGCTKHVQPPGTTTCVLCDHQQPEILSTKVVSQRANEIRAALSRS